MLISLAIFVPIRLAKIDAVAFGNQFLSYMCMLHEFDCSAPISTARCVRILAEPALDPQCMELIRELQDAGALWAINTGRSVDLLESGLADFAFLFRPDFILTTERDSFVPAEMATNGKRSAIGTSAARAIMPSLFSSAQSVLAEVIDFVNQKTKARLIYDSDRLEGLARKMKKKWNTLPNSSTKRAPGIQSSITSETVFTCVFAMPITTKARRSQSWRV